MNPCDGLVCATNIADTTFRYVDCERVPTTAHECHGRTRHLCARCVDRYAMPVVIHEVMQ